MLLQSVTKVWNVITINVRKTLRTGQSYNFVANYPYDSFMGTILKICGSKPAPLESACKPCAMGQPKPCEGNWVVSRGSWRNTWWSYSLSFTKFKLLSDCSFGVKLTLPHFTLWSLGPEKSYLCMVPKIWRKPIPPRPMKVWDKHMYIRWDGKSIFHPFIQYSAGPAMP